MKTILILSLGILLTGCATQAPLTFAPGLSAGYGQTAACAEPNDEALNSVVRLKSADGGHASGVVIGPDRIVTVAHILESDSSLEVEIAGEIRSGYVLSVDEENDLALLAVETGDTRPVAMSHSPMRKFEPVWAVGFPLSLEQYTTWGRFQIVHQGRLYTSAPITSGNSGGGLLRCDAGQFELAGLVQSFHGYRRGQDFISAGHLSVVIPSSEIETFLIRSGVHVALN